MATSYFVGVDATESYPQMFLTGDHNINNGVNGNPPTSFVSSKLVAFPTNTAVALTGPGWGDNMHQKQGNVGLADGSVQQFSRTRVQEALRNSGDNDHNGVANSSNRLQFP
jgi:prepilin-type processing-associated H-X9-DG protein